MKNLLYVCALLFLSVNMSVAGYEVDFLIEDAPVSSNRLIRLKQFNLSSAVIKEDEDNAQIGDEIEPLQAFKVRISDLSNPININSDHLCDFLNESEEEKGLNKLWQSIVFTVKQENLPDEDVALYWAPSQSSLFVNGGSEHFVLSAFQRDLPKKDKSGNFKCAVKINFFEKKMD
jgi:hypothetical protein